MLRYTSCHPEHVKFVHVQAMQASDKPAMRTAEAAAVIEQSRMSLSAWAGNECMGVAGVYDVHPGRAMAWALLSCNIGPHMLSVTRKVRFVLNSINVKRIECLVPYEFAAAHRFARMVGFELETECMRHYNVDGSHVSAYVRID